MQEDSFREPNPPCTNLIAKLISTINVDNDAGKGLAMSQPQ